MANVLKRLTEKSALLAPDIRSFKRQESSFVVLNLFVLAGLLLIHTLFSSLFGTPPRPLLIVLSVGFLINVIELIWIQGASFLGPDGIVALTWFTIGLNMTLGFSLASLSYRQDTQYFALFAAPVLQAAFRLRLSATVFVVLVSTILEFFWVWSYFQQHPQSHAGEYLSEYIEAGTISLIYAMVGIIVWNLVNQVRAKERDLTASLAALETTKERLLIEEKLAAVGRFSSAIAHEIRNPVAMISSALSTALKADLDNSEREQMFEIAGKEASRLEKLTTDFLAYARPRPPVKQIHELAEWIAYVADICRPKAAERQISIVTEASPGLRVSIDSGQIQQALLNLVMNAIEASSAGGAVNLRSSLYDGLIEIAIENGNGPIPPEVANRVFEPFFTTKPSGTGLGLAIAHNIARAHGGDVVLSRNSAASVQFSLTLPALAGESKES